MRKVVDSNYLRSPKLAVYLSASPHNHIVLSDYCGMEAHKGDTLTTVRESMATPCRFPRQVIVIKPTYVICGLSNRAKGLQQRLIHSAATARFSTYCRALTPAQLERVGIQEQLLANGEAAADLQKSIEAAVPNFVAVIPDVHKALTGDERAVIRGREALSSLIVNKIVGESMRTAATLFSRDPRVRVAPDYDSLINDYTFRFAICANLLAIDWAARGGATGAKTSTMLNALIASPIATCDT